jgi:hypothetical protein
MTDYVTSGKKIGPYVLIFAFAVEDKEHIIRLKRGSKKIIERKYMDSNRAKKEYDAVLLVLRDAVEYFQGEDQKKVESNLDEFSEYGKF